MLTICGQQHVIYPSESNEEGRRRAGIVEYKQLSPNFCHPVNQKYNDKRDWVDLGFFYG